MSEDSPSKEARMREGKKGVGGIQGVDGVHGVDGYNGTAKVGESKSSQRTITNRQRSAGRTINRQAGRVLQAGAGADDTGRQSSL